MRISSVAHLEDPCPLPTQLKKRTLNEKERCVYAPMCGLGGIVYDGDAIYIDTQGSHSQQAKPHALTAEMGARAERRHTVDERIKATPLTVFAHSEQPVLADNRFVQTVLLLYHIAVTTKWRLRTTMMMEACQTAVIGQI